MQYRFYLSIVFFALMLLTYQSANARDGDRGGGRENFNRGGQGEQEQHQDLYVPQDARGNSYREQGQGGSYMRGYSRGQTNEENQQNYENAQPVEVYPPGYPTTPQQPSGDWQQSPN